MSQKGNLDPGLSFITKDTIQKKLEVIGQHDILEVSVRVDMT